MEPSIPRRPSDLGIVALCRLPDSDAQIPISITSALPTTLEDRTFATTDYEPILCLIVRPMQESKFVTNRDQGRAWLFASPEDGLS
jgi:hypothetical protein